MSVTTNGYYILIDEATGQEVSRHSSHVKVFDLATDDAIPDGTYRIKQPDLILVKRKQRPAPAPAPEPAPAPAPEPAPAPPPPAPPPPPPPPLAKIWSRVAASSIGLKSYADPAYQAALAKCRLAIIGFYVQWGQTLPAGRIQDSGDGAVIRKVVQQLKALNPALLVAQYTVLNEQVADKLATSNDDVVDWLDANGAWLLKADGTRTQWTTKYGAYETHFMGPAAPRDAAGKNYAVWLAERNVAKLFTPVPEFDFVYSDNTMKWSRVTADFFKSGVDVAGSDPAAAAAFRQGQLEYWNAARGAGRGVIGNADNDLSFPEYKGALDAAFLENIDGMGFFEAWNRYQRVSANVRRPELVVFHVNLTREEAPHWLCLALLGDGLFSFTEAGTTYGIPPSLPEMEIALGNPIQAKPSYVSGGIMSRLYEGGMVAVNTSTTALDLHLPPGYSRYPDNQTGTVSLPPRSGLIAVK